MKGFLLDTNIPSEMTRTRPQSSVSGWLDDADDDQLHFSVVSPRRDSEGRYRSSGKPALQPTAAVAR